MHEKNDFEKKDPITAPEMKFFDQTLEYKNIVDKVFLRFLNIKENCQFRPSLRYLSVYPAFLFHVK